MTEVPDQVYLQRVLDGDDNAFRFLVDRYQDMAFGLALQLLKNREDAEEVAMDAFAKCYRSLGSFKAESRFSTWLYRIVYNTAISKGRKKKLTVSAIDDRIVEQAPEQDIQSAMAQMQQEERQKYLGLAMEKLHPEDVTLVQLYYLAGRPTDEVAEITGMTVSNVKVRLHRARKKLYFYLERLLRDELKTLL
ncbi:MAG: RNA polymerase sigma factor [Salibacteraceae bacterium]